MIEMDLHEGLNTIKVVASTVCKKSQHYRAFFFALKEEKHVHAYSEEVTIAPTCTTVGEMTYTCACGDVQKAELPINPVSHKLNDANVCEYCEENFTATISVEDAIALGLTYENGKYGSDYYYITLTVDDQVNANGFARATIKDTEEEKIYVTVAGGYKTAVPYVDGTIEKGDTVTFLAKLGAANSAKTTGGRELRLYEVADAVVIAKAPAAQ